MQVHPIQLDGNNFTKELLEINGWYDNPVRPIRLYSAFPFRTHLHNQNTWLTRLNYETIRSVYSGVIEYISYIVLYGHQNPYSINYCYRSNDQNIMYTVSTPPTRKHLIIVPEMNFHVAVDMFRKNYPKTLGYATPTTILQLERALVKTDVSVIVVTDLFVIRTNQNSSSSHFTSTLFENIFIDNGRNDDCLKRMYKELFTLKIWLMYDTTSRDVAVPKNMKTMSIIHSTGSPTTGSIPIVYIKDTMDRDIYEGWGMSLKSAASVGYFAPRFDVLPYYDTIELKLKQYFNTTPSYNMLPHQLDICTFFEKPTQVRFNMIKKVFTHKIVGNLTPLNECIICLADNSDDLPLASTVFEYTTSCCGKNICAQCYITHQNTSLGNPSCPNCRSVDYIGYIDSDAKSMLTDTFNSSTEHLYRAHMTQLSNSQYIKNVPKQYHVLVDQLINTIYSNVSDLKLMQRVTERTVVVIDRHEELYGCNFGETLAAILAETGAVPKANWSVHDFMSQSECNCTDPNHSCYFSYHPYEIAQAQSLDLLKQISMVGVKNKIKHKVILIDFKTYLHHKLFDYKPLIGLSWVFVKMQDTGLSTICNKFNQDSEPNVPNLSIIDINTMFSYPTNEEYNYVPIEYLTVCSVYNKIDRQNTSHVHPNNIIIEM